MSYRSIDEMARSESLIGRLAAAAAREGVKNPSQWVQVTVWELVSAPTWDVQWDYAVDTLTVNVNPDIGARTDVISDADLLARVQALKPGP